MSIWDFRQCVEAATPAWIIPFTVLVSACLFFLIVAGGGPRSKP